MNRLFMEMRYKINAQVSFVAAAVVVAVAVVAAFPVVPLFAGAVPAAVVPVVYLLRLPPLFQKSLPRSA